MGFMSFGHLGKADRIINRCGRSGNRLPLGERGTPNSPVGAGWHPVARRTDRLLPADLSAQACCQQERRITRLLTQIRPSTLYPFLDGRGSVGMIFDSSTPSLLPYLRPGLILSPACQSLVRRAGARGEGNYCHAYFVTQLLVDEGCYNKIHIEQSSIGSIPRKYR